MNVETAARLMDASISETAREETLRGEVAGFAVDSRAVEAGQIFFAGSEEDYRRHSFTGAKFEDSHRFIPQAFERGAAAVVARRERFEMYEELRSFEDRLLFVDDTIGALQTLAQRVLKAWGQPIVGITGSAGKTTTRNLTAHVLASAGRRVLQSQKNYNNELGLPLAILQMESAGNSPSDYDVAVLEMGMSTPGELRRVVRLAPPDIAVELCVTPVHLEHFGTIESIAENKRAVVEGLKPNGTAVLNADDERVLAMRDALKPGGRTLTFGIENKADVTATEIEAVELGRTRFNLQTSLGEFRAELPIPGRHNLMNALAAASVATCFGIEPQAIAHALSSASASEMRGVVFRFRDGFTLIDDSYNSNPSSLMHMVRTLVEGGQGAHRRIVVAGEMLELGADAAEMHREAGREIGRAEVDLLWGVRGFANELVAGAREAGMSAERTRFFETVEEAALALMSELRAGDILLVKGSRGVRTDKIVRQLREQFPLQAEDNEEK